MEQNELLLRLLAEVRENQAMLQSTNSARQDTNAMLRKQLRQRDDEIERLNQIIRNLQRARFGQSNEKSIYVLEDGSQQLSVFDTQEQKEEVPVPEVIPPVKEEVSVAGHTRKKKRTLEELCAALPVEEHVIDLPEEEKTVNGHELTCIGLEYIRTELVVEKAKVKVVKHYRKVCADRELEQETGYSEVFKPEVTPPLLEHSYAPPPLSLPMC